MKTCLLLVFSLLLCSTVRASNLVAIAVVEAIPGSKYTQMKRPGCADQTEQGEIVVCTASWVRHKLSKVVRLDGTRLPNTIALIFTDPQIDGPKLLELLPLSATEAKLYGASYKAVQVTSLFSGACLDTDIPVGAEDKVLGPTHIDLYGAANCYLLPVWWAK